VFFVSAFTDRLKELRKAKNVTQANVAEAINCVEQYYQKIEYGKIKPKYDKIEQLADFFDVSIDYLLGRSDIPERR